MSTKSKAPHPAKPWLTLVAIALMVAFVFLVPALWMSFSRRSDITGRIAAVALSIIVIVSVFIAWRFH